METEVYYFDAPEEELKGPRVRYYVDEKGRKHEVEIGTADFAANKNPLYEAPVPPFMQGAGTRDKRFPVKCVLVGDEVAAKRDLLMLYTYIDDQYETDALNTMIKVAVTIGHNKFCLNINDITGIEHSQDRFPLYRETDVFIICFSINSSSSFENVSNKWAIDIIPKIPFLVVGIHQSSSTTYALHKETIQRSISKAQAVEMSRQIGAFAYLECSTVTGKGVKKVFKQAALAGATNSLKSNSISVEHSDEISYYIGLAGGSIYLTTKKLVLVGAPCVGKTAFKALLFNWPAPKHHHSTAIASRPIRAIERVTDRKEGRIWDVVESKEIFKTITDAIHEVDENESTIQEEKNVDEFSESDDQLDDDVEMPLENTTITNESKQQLQPHITQPSLDDNYSSEASKADQSKEVIEMIKKRKKTKKSRALHKATWVHILDSGGQPQFADISRAFLRGNAVNVIVFKLTEKLSDKPRFTYSLGGRVMNAPSELQMTNLQLIEHFVRSVAASDTTTIKIGHNKIVTRPYFIIVGTYFDQATKGVFTKREITEETIADKNHQIYSALYEFRDRIIFYNEESNEIIFPVDNLCRLNRKKISAQIRERIMSQEGVGFKVPIPIRWYMFELHMRKAASKTKHGIVSLVDCYDIGARVEMSSRDVKSSLVYFDCLTLCLYFEKILPDIIFTNPQYLLDMLTNIVRVSFIKRSDLEIILPKDKYLSDEVQRLLQEDGVFEETLLDLLDLPFVDSLFTKHDFLRLLQYIFVIAPIKAPNSNSIYRYFIPVVLPSEKMTSDEKQFFREIIEPLIITFQSKLVLQGLFPTIVVSLLNREVEPHFFIDSHYRNFPRQLRHAVLLYSDDLTGSVLLCEENHSIEVYFTGLRKYCPLLRQVILDALNTSATTLAYDVNTLKMTALPQCIRNHAIPANNETPHPITISYQESPPAISCSIETLPLIELTDEKQSCWLIAESMEFPSLASGSQVLPEGILSEVVLRNLNSLGIVGVDHGHIILSAIKKVYLWEILGIYLGLNFDMLEEIKRKNHHQIEPCRKNMIYKWLQGGTATVQTLATALKTMGKNNIVQTLPTTVTLTDDCLDMPMSLPEGILDEGHAPIILSLLKDVYWEELAIFIGIDTSLSEQIKLENHHQVDICCMTMVIKWLQGGNATVKSLVSALESVGKINVATKILRLQGKEVEQEQESVECAFDLMELLEDLMASS